MTEKALSIFVRRPRGLRKRAPSIAGVTLDAAQRELVEMPLGKHLLVLGEAGYGKTTVLVMRLLRLYRRERELRMVVIVPSEGLQRMLQGTLRKLGVDVLVATYDVFARRQAKRAFAWLPRESESAPLSVTRLKRHPVMRKALAILKDREPGIIDDDADAARKMRSRFVSRGDLQHLFGDAALVRNIAAEGRLGERSIGDTLDRIRVQIGQTTEDEWSFVEDKSRLRAIDGKRIDEGTATSHADTIDVEDYAILFELDRLRADRRGVAPTALRPYDVIAIDEAEELAPLEFALLGRSLAKAGTFIVSGDAEQHTDEGSTFGGWDEAIAELGLTNVTRAMLDVGYRCPEDIVAAARFVRDGRKSEAKGVVRSHQLRRVGFSDEGTLVARLGPEMSSILDHDPHASIAVLCRKPLRARRLHAALLPHVPARLVFDGRFLPRGPVQVTTVLDTKGLEFDYVVVPDASVDEYPVEPSSRRLFYVALTRARFQVILAHCSTETALLSSFEEPRA